MDNDLPAYLRHPTLHGETIVFVADDDLWTVGAAGGVARRLTAASRSRRRPASRPTARCSRSSAATSSIPRSTSCRPRAARRGASPGSAPTRWCAAGRRRARSSTSRPRASRSSATTTRSSSTCGRHAPAAALGPGQPPRHGPGERKVIGRNTADPARWKRYRGGTAGRALDRRRGRRQFRRMKRARRQHHRPMWIGDRVWFLSDREGIGNLYSCRPDGSDLRRHTDHEAFYARHAQTDGKRIVYQCGAKIRLFDPASDSDREVDIRTARASRAGGAGSSPRGDHLESFGVASGRATALALVGAASCSRMALLEGAARPLRPGRAPAACARQWLSNSSKLVAVGDAWGEERHKSVRRPRARDAALGRRPHPAHARRAARAVCVAFTNRATRLIGRRRRRGAAACRRPPPQRPRRRDHLVDRRRLAGLAFAAARATGAIGLHDVAANTSTVTAAQIRDCCAVVRPRRQVPLLLSLPTFDPSLRQHPFEISFPRAAPPYLIAFQAGGQRPFDPEPEGLKRRGPARCRRSRGRR